MPIGRSENMRRIRSKDTKPEMMIRRALFRRGLRYRINCPGLPGKPDIVFRQKKLTIFVHGCFWHQHPGCREASRPRSNTGYWHEKLAKNVARDLHAQTELQRLGYLPMIIWECVIEKDLKRTVEDIVYQLSGSKVQ
jgi:DNA mismatch endonuclease (patch repair protein)